MDTNAVGRIRGVIFDMDGVLTNSEPLINAAAVAMFREKGLAVQREDFLPFIGAGEDRYLGGVAEKYGFPLDVPAAKKRTYEIYLQLVPDQLEAFAGARELVLACRPSGLRVAVASSADLVKIDANLRKIDLPSEVWDAVVSGDEITNKKPAPDIFLAAAAKLGLAPAECAVIEDAVNGVEAAKAAGMRCLAVAHTFSPEQLRAADLVRERIADLTLDDLRGSPAAGSSSNPPLVGPAPPGPVAGPPRETARGPWGFWPTMGLFLVIGAAVVFAQGLIGIVLLAGSFALKRPLELEDLESNGLLLSVATCLSAPVSVGLSWLFARLRKGISVKEYFGLNPVEPRVVRRWCLALLVLIVLSDGLTALLGRPIVPDFMVNAYQTSILPPLLVFVLIVVAPLSEETLFRGFVFQGVLHSRLGAAGAIMLSSLLWAVIHLQYDSFGISTIFVGGLVLGFARWKTGSIYPCIIMHALMNLIATIQVMVLHHAFGV